MNSRYEICSMKSIGFRNLKVPKRLTFAHPIQKPIYGGVKNILRKIQGDHALMVWLYQCNGLIDAKGKVNAIRDAIESLHELPGLSETGKLLFSRATLKIYDRPTLRAVVQNDWLVQLRR